MTVRAPFGLLTQPESEYLSLGRVDTRYRELLRTIRMRVDGRTQKCHDTVPRLAWWSGLGERQTQYGLKTLSKLGLIAREGRRTVGGSRGTAWAWTTKSVPYTEWPSAPLERLILSINAYIQTFWPRQEDAPPAPSSAKRVHRLKEEDAQNEGRRRRTTRDKSREVPRRLLQERLTRLRAGTDDDCGDAVGGRVIRWVERRGAARLRFADDLAGRWLAAAITRALSSGSTPADVDRAIALHIEEPFADPRELPLWVAEVEEARLNAEQLKARARELLAEREREDAAIRSEREAPGYVERMGAAIAEGRGLLGLGKTAS